MASDSTTADNYVSAMSAANNVTDSNGSNDGSSTRISTFVSSSASTSSFIITSPSTNFNERGFTADSNTVGTSSTSSTGVSSSSSPSTSFYESGFTDDNNTLGTSPTNSIRVGTSPIRNTVVSISTSTDSSTSLSATTTVENTTDVVISVSAGAITNSFVSISDISTSLSTSTSVRSNLSTGTTVETTTNVVHTSIGTSASLDISVDSSSVGSDATLIISSIGSFSTSNDESTSSAISSSPSANTKVSTSFTADDSTKASSSPSNSTNVTVITDTSFGQSTTSSQIGQENATDWHSVTQTLRSSSYTTGRGTTRDVTTSSSTTVSHFSSSIAKTSSTAATHSASVSDGISDTVSEAIGLASTPKKWIAAPVLCGAFILVAVIIIIILVKLRRMPKCKFRRCFEKHKDGPYSAPLTALPATEYARPQAVRMSDFIAHVANLHKDAEFGFSAEFEVLKEQNLCEQFPKSAAELPENRMKNRYINILPFDKDRVKLVPMDDDMIGSSDYINASFIPGVLSRREYIATQGPIPGTIDDFWRMIWEYNITTIVMVTDLVENGRVLTCQYWPNQNEPVHYGDIRVEPISEAVVGTYVLRTFSVSLDDRNRLVKQFHLTNWKDRTQFDNVEQFLAFQGDVRRSLTNSPMLVHCSAGVGRTGTFIAVDHLLRKIETDPNIDVFHLVQEMRSHRTSMVQTLTQYCFVHDCISYAIEHAYDKRIPIPLGDSLQDLKESQNCNLLFFLCIPLRES